MEVKTRYKDRPFAERLAITLLVYTAHIGVAYLIVWLAPPARLTDVIAVQALWIAIVAGSKAEDAK